MSDDAAARLRGLERRGLMPGTHLDCVSVSDYESPIVVRIKGRRVSVPLGLARAIFVEGARSGR